MALANIVEIRDRRLVEWSAEAGGFLSQRLATIADLGIGRAKATLISRGLGLLAGLELVLSDGSPATKLTIETVKRLLRRGFIFLAEGEHGNVISFTPPLTISKAQLASAVEALEKVLRESLG
jgi:4-aminobutyrate aminotransferase-like enzyme